MASKPFSHCVYYSSCQSLPCCLLVGFIAAHPPLARQNSTVQTKSTESCEASCARRGLSASPSAGTHCHPVPHLPYIWCWLFCRFCEEQISTDPKSYSHRLSSELQHMTAPGDVPGLPYRRMFRGTHLEHIQLLGRSSGLAFELEYASVGARRKQVGVHSLKERNSSAEHEMGSQPRGEGKTGLSFWPRRRNKLLSKARS